MNESRKVYRYIVTLRVPRQAGGIRRDRITGYGHALDADNGALHIRAVDGAIHVYNWRSVIGYMYQEGDDDERQ